MNEVINKEVKFIDLGLRDYQEVWDYQENLFYDSVNLKIENRKQTAHEQKPTPNYLIFCEHPHVFTLGKSGDEKNLLLNEAELREKSATYYKINRGGDITYHGPGQIVGYPILDLENFFTDIHLYMRNLEEAVIRLLRDYSIDSGRIKGLTGVWIDYHEGADNPRKICAFGVKSSRWVTMHGLALNVNAILEYFDYIVPCGIEDKAVTSMDKELGRSLDFKEVKNGLRKHLADVFNMKLID